LAQIKIELGDHEQGRQCVPTMAGKPWLGISLGVLGVAIALSVLTVVGGYFAVTR
jgi:hypothetical protein